MTRIRLAASFRIIKYLMILFNLLFWIFGIMIFSVGIYAASTNSIIPLDDHHAGAYLFIFVGCVIMITGFLGCCGALKESPCMLMMFFIVLFIIFIFLMAATLWAVAYKGKVERKLAKVFEKRISKYDNKELSESDRAYIDNAQKEYKCCGAYGSTDYMKNVPESCGENHSEYSNRKGCYTKFLDFAKENLNKIIGFGITIAIIMLFGMVFSIMLYCAIKETEKLTNQ